MTPMVAQPSILDEKAEAFWQRLCLPEEERRRLRAWEGSYRWFRSPNVVKLELYRSPVEMDRIRAILLTRWAR